MPNLPLDTRLHLLGFKMGYVSDVRSHKNILYKIYKFERSKQIYKDHIPENIDPYCVHIE